mgnify:CR=1 FL=1
MRHLLLATLATLSSLTSLALNYLLLLIIVLLSSGDAIDVNVLPLLPGTRNNGYLGPGGLSAGLNIFNKPKSKKRDYTYY